MEQAYFVKFFDKNNKEISAEQANILPQSEYSIIFTDAKNNVLNSTDSKKPCLKLENIKVFSKINENYKKNIDLFIPQKYKGIMENNFFVIYYLIIFFFCEILSIVNTINNYCFSDGKNEKLEENMEFTTATTEMITYNKNMFFSLFYIRIIFTSFQIVVFYSFIFTALDSDEYFYMFFNKKTTFTHMAVVAIFFITNIIPIFFFLYFGVGFFNFFSVDGAKVTVYGYYLFADKVLFDDIFNILSFKNFHIFFHIMNIFNITLMALYIYDICNEEKYTLVFQKLYYVLFTYILCFLFVCFYTIIDIMFFRIRIKRKNNNSLSAARPAA